MINRNLKSKDEILNTLSYEERNKASLFFDFAEKEGLREDFKITAKYYSYTYYPQISPRPLFKMDIDNKEIRIKANLFFIEKHEADLHFLNENLKGMIRNTPQCTRCSLNCKQGVSFKMDGESYFACINEGHYFKKMQEEECRMLISLIKSELEAVKSLK